MTEKPMLVVIESPLRGNVPAWVTRWLPLIAPLFERVGRARNRAYARACVRDSLLRGEAPYASHVHYDLPGVLNDAIPSERALGMEAGFAVGDRCDRRAVYIDRGLSGGMKLGIEKALAAGQPVVLRTLEEAPNNINACTEAVAWAKSHDPELLFDFELRDCRCGLVHAGSCASPLAEASR